MRKLVSLIYKSLEKIMARVGILIHTGITLIILYGNNVKFKKIHTKGIPYIKVARNASFTIGDNFRMNNNIKANPIGRVQRCSFAVNKEAKLQIGNNVGMSSTAIVAHKSVQIADNVLIGGGVCIYDTDFHSLDPEIRKDKGKDRKMKMSTPVEIKKNVFIGAHSTILKGVTIGENSIIGACSLVTKDVPSNEIWAGNPAKFRKKLDLHD